MSWRVPMLTEPVVVASEQSSPGEKEEVPVQTPMDDPPVTTTVDTAVQCSAPVTTTVDAAVQYVRPKFQYGKGPNEDVVRRMMRYLQQ